MAIQLQIRRGTTAENDLFTGAVGELTMDTDTKGMRLHDGSTQGGIQVPTADTADYVVEWQVPTDLNNYTWYRKYKSGWVEQGVLELSFTTTDQTWTFPIPMANTNYVSMPVKQANNNNYTVVYQDSATSVKYRTAAGSQQTGGIYICGMSAQ